MVIGIDGNEANVARRVGIGEYSFELLKQFSKFTIYNLQFTIYLKGKPLDDLPRPREGWEYRIVGPKKLWTQIGLPLELFLHRPRPDVFFTPTHYAPRFSPVPTVISIMDLSYIHFPQMFKKSDLYQLKNWTAYSVKKASKVLTISQVSKDDIINYYMVKPEKIVVTYPGIKVKSQNSPLRPTSQDFAGQAKLKTKYDLEGEYILFVGTLQPRKNIVRLVEAFAKIIGELNSPFQFGESSNASVPASSSAGLGIRPAKRGLVKTSPHEKAPRSLFLVIIGKKGWMWEEILEAPKKFGVEKYVKFLDFVPEEDLPVLYQNALCFILPSLYEGFGLPVLEAMVNGCPVITSNVSSLPEAGGDAALYVDPDNVDDIASKIRLLIENEKLRQELIEKGYQQVKKFSWEKTAKETLKVLQEVARDSK